jgi:lipoprotein-anchoring transpeptidase ErfK/SrfK
MHQPAARVRIIAASAALLALAALAGCSNPAHSAQPDPTSDKPSGSSSSQSSQPSQSSAAPTTAAPTATTPARPVASIAMTSAQISPARPISVKVTSGTLGSVKVTDAAGAPVAGAYSASRASWASTGTLAYGGTYTVSAAARGTDGQTVRKSGTVTTVAPAVTAYPSVIPAPATTEFGVGEPIAVRFDQPITDKVAAQKALSVTSSPAQAGAWYWISDRQVDYRPQVYWQPGTKITLHADVLGVNLGGGVYGQESRTINYSVHDSWRAVANAGDEHMTIYHNGQAVKTMNVSMGKTQTPTHNGPHVIQMKQQEYTMNSCTYGVCSGPASYISKEYYVERISDDGEFVHENPNSVASQGVANVSHGCINLNQADAIWFYNHLGVGDVVEVVNSTGPKLPLGDTWGDWEVPWSVWSAGNA